MKKMMKKMEIKNKFAKIRYKATYKKFIELVNDEESNCKGMDPIMKGFYLIGFYTGIKDKQKETYAKIFNK